MNTRTLLQDLTTLSPGSRAYAQALRNVLSATPLGDPSYKAVMDEWFALRSAHLAALEGGEHSDHAAVLVPRITLPFETPAGYIELTSAAIGAAAALSVPIIFGSVWLLLLGLPVGLVVTAVLQDRRNRDLQRRLSRLRLPETTSAAWTDVEPSGDLAWPAGAA